MAHIQPQPSESICGGGWPPSRQNSVPPRRHAFNTHLLYGNFTKGFISMLLLDVLQLCLLLRHHLRQAIEELRDSRPSHRHPLNVAMHGWHRRPHYRSEGSSCMRIAPKYSAVPRQKDLIGQEPFYRSGPVRDAAWQFCAPQSANCFRKRVTLTRTAGEEAMPRTENDVARGICQTRVRPSPTNGVHGCSASLSEAANQSIGRNRTKDD